MSFLQRQEYHARLQKETHRVYAKMVQDVEKQHRQLIERPRWASYPPRANIDTNEQHVESSSCLLSSAVSQPMSSRPDSPSSITSTYTTHYSRLELRAENNPDDRNFFTNSFAKYYPTTESVSTVNDAEEETELQSRAPRKGRWLVFGAEKLPEYTSLPPMLPANGMVSETTPSSRAHNIPSSVSKLTLNFNAADFQHSALRGSLPATTRSTISGKKLTTANPSSTRTRKSSPSQLSLFERKSMRYSLPQTVIPGILEEKKKREEQLHVRKHKGSFYHQVPLKKVQD